jgi:mRNA-degrading endonuclease RelE of RelBE toxin-antitoxin system
MKFSFSERARRDYDNFSVKLRARVDKQISALLKDIRYPSLKAKKYDEKRGIWQMRISKDYRLYFTIDNDVYIIVTITKHPK